MTDEDQEPDYFVRLREDEEMEFFMELAIHETERWIQAVTKKVIQYPDDTRKSLENGVLLCELLNCLKPGVIKRINRLPTPIAGLDNINVFLKMCKTEFGLTDSQLFNPSDLEDLSQRAIAETDQLKEEYDKRLINVAITIFWLGKYAAKNYQGPQLDLSAYSAFVHHKHHTDLVEEFHREQAHNLSSQWDWAHGSRSRTAAIPGSVDLSFQHIRDNSYDSTEKASFDSLDEPDSRMPLTRYSSASALNKNRDSQNFTTLDSSYSNDRNSSLYRSSPDLAQGGSSHRRYSSTDSMDDSHNSGHSRQGSDAQEINYVTRRLSTQSSRKSSSSTDPLQFVKLKGAMDLAYTAEVQMRVAAESKIGASISRAKDDDADWQSDLSSWKNRRKSQSEKTYQQQQDLDQKDDITQTSVTKTYSQMKEEREKRKSSGRSFYPIADENDDAFGPDISSKLVSSTSSITQSASKGGIAPWAKDSDDEEEKENKKHNGTASDDQNDKNNNLSDLIKQSEDSQENSKYSSRRALANKHRAYDQDDVDNSVTYRKSNVAEKHNQRFVDSSVKNVSGNNSSSSAANGKRWQSKNEDLTNKSENYSKWNKDSVKPDINGDSSANNKFSSRKSESFGKAIDVFSKNDSVSDKDYSNQKITTVGNVGSRTQNKIGSIMKNFTESENKSPEPKQGYNEKIDLSARKSAFMKSTEEPAVVPVPARRSFGPHYSKEESESDTEEIQDKSDELDQNKYFLEDNKVTSHPPIPSSNPPNFTQKPMATVSPAVVSSPNIMPDDSISKKSLEKIIKISQKANSDKGFGFFLTGGVDKNAPIAVSKVTLGSSADLNDLKVKDVILSVNHIDVSDKSTSEVGDLVAKCVSAGFIEMKIQREMSDDDLEEEEDFSSSDEGEEDLQPQEYSENTQASSVMSQLTAEKEWLEKQIEDNEKQERKTQKANSMNVEYSVFPLAEQSHNIKETKSQLTLSLDRYQDSLDDTLSPSSYNARPSPNSSQNLEDDSDGSGPPAILRKWQRQRHKEEYTFDPVSDASETFKRISLNASLPRRRDSEEAIKEYVKSQPTETKTASTQNWEQRMEEWSQQQDDERHNYENITFTTQAKITEDNKRLQEKYEEDLRKAEERIEEKKKQEDEALQSRIDTAKVLEERKAERRARIQQSAAEATGSMAPKESPPAPPPKFHTTSMTMNISRQQNADFSVYHPKPFVPVTASTGSLIIDPRNQQGSQDHSLQFQMKVGSQPAIGQETLLLLEAERELIRKEELKKIEEERKRLEEEQKAKETEKLKAIREKEEEVRRQQELLELERQKFQKEQEEFQKHKQQQEQLLQEQQLLKQKQEKLLKEKQQEQLYREQQLQKQQQEQQYQKQQEDQLLRKQQQQETQRVQPVAAKRQSAAPALREKSSSLYSSSPPSTSPARHSYVAGNNNQNSDQKRSAGTYSKISQSFDTPNSSGSRDSDSSSGGHRFSREQMLAMNRKATPMQAVPPETQQAIKENELEQSSVPVTREAHTRLELHSLNSVPRAKLRDPSEIYVNVGTTNPALSPRHPEPAKRYTAPWMDEGEDRNSSSSKRHTFSALAGDHWLVEEAERRRLAEAHNKQPESRSSVHSSHFTGPIKPATDNHWRGNSFDGTQSSSMPQAIRQTLLQKTSGLRGSTPDLTNNSSRSSSGSPSQTTHDSRTDNVHNLNSLLKDFKQTYPLPNQPSHQSRYSQLDSESSKTPVNGKQPCSHCSQEIGFGTAMVIEALGLFYHVQCFRCCVCHASLGSGQHGADVRVRGSKLHCPNCYSNDEAGLKFSKV